MPGQLLEAGDVDLSLRARRVFRRQGCDQAADPVSDLKREMGRRRASEGTDVLDAHRRILESIRSFSLAHGLGQGWSFFEEPGGGALPPVSDLTGTNSARSST